MRYTSFVAVSQYTVVILDGSGLVGIAATPEEFVDAIQNAMDEDAAERRARASEFLSSMSWDKTYDAMSDLISEAIASNDKGRAAETATVGKY